MEIKDKIKIGSMEYEVIKTDKPILLNDQACNGVIDYENLFIEISTNRATQKQEETLMHEVLHGIIHERNLILEDEEMIVEEISKGLYQVIKDNPDIFTDKKITMQKDQTHAQLIYDSKNTDKIIHEVSLEVEKKLIRKLCLLFHQ